MILDRLLETDLERCEPIVERFRLRPVELHHLQPILVAADDFNRFGFYGCYDGLSHRICRFPRKSEISPVSIPEMIGGYSKRA